MKPSKAGAHHSGLLLFRDVDGRHRVGGARVGHTGGGRRSALSPVDGCVCVRAFLQVGLGLFALQDAAPIPPSACNMLISQQFTLSPTQKYTDRLREGLTGHKSRIAYARTKLQYTRHRLPPAPRVQDTKSRSCGLSCSPPLALLGPGLAYSALSPTSACRHCTRWIHRKPSSPSGLQPDLGFLPPSTTRLWSSGSR